ncbi:hypothetical protein GCM10010393_49220 [Streptomyces gobitricini]|uniref:Uncharacterized protein n=1 Tax=Streptomyces gobitricini TaxID=68211 RepID=A0ABP6A884_9ACTN
MGRSPVLNQDTSHSTSAPAATEPTARKGRAPNITRRGYGHPRSWEAVDEGVRGGRLVRPRDPSGPFSGPEGTGVVVAPSA